MTYIQNLMETLTLHQTIHQYWKWSRCFDGETSAFSLDPEIREVDILCQLYATLILCSWDSVTTDFPVTDILNANIYIYFF